MQRSAAQHSTFRVSGAQSIREGPITSSKQVPKHRLLLLRYERFPADPYLQYIQQATQPPSSHSPLVALVASGWDDGLISCLDKLRDRHSTGSHGTSRCTCRPLPVLLIPYLLNTLCIMPSFLVSENLVWVSCLVICGHVKLGGMKMLLLLVAPPPCSCMAVGFRGRRRLLGLGTEILTFPFLEFFFSFLLLSTCDSVYIRLGRTRPKSLEAEDPWPLQPPNPQKSANLMMLSSCLMRVCVFLSLSLSLFLCKEMLRCVVVILGEY